MKRTEYIDLLVNSKAISWFVKFSCDNMKMLYKWFTLYLNFLQNRHKIYRKYISEGLRKPGMHMKKSVVGQHKDQVSHKKSPWWTSKCMLPLRKHSLTHFCSFVFSVFFQDWRYLLSTVFSLLLRQKCLFDCSFCKISLVSSLLMSTTH